MAHPYKSSDVPEFTTYPEPPEQQAPESFRRTAAAFPPAGMNKPGMSDPVQDFGSDVDPGQLGSGASVNRGESPLHEPARKIGAALGQAVAGLRERTSVAGEWAEQKKDAAKVAIDTTIDAASERYSALVQDRLLQAQERFDDLRERASDITRRAHRDYPVQLILAAGAAGLLVGVGLRIWRENRG